MNLLNARVDVMTDVIREMAAFVPHVESRTALRDWIISKASQDLVLSEGWTEKASRGSFHDAVRKHLPDCRSDFKDGTMRLIRGAYSARDFYSENTLWSLLLSFHLIHFFIHLRLPRMLQQKRIMLTFFSMQFFFYSRGSFRKQS
jgi:hypothetical protein